jgi:hypothetical protein
LAAKLLQKKMYIDKIPIATIASLPRIKKSLIWTLFANKVTMPSNLAASEVGIANVPYWKFLDE